MFLAVPWKTGRAASTCVHCSMLNCLSLRDPICAFRTLVRSCRPKQ